MSEEDNHPPLQAIPARPLQKSIPDERRVIALVNALKENVEVKQDALRKDLEEKIEEVSASSQSAKDEMLQENQSLREEMHQENQAIREEVREENQVLRSEITASIAQLQERLENTSLPTDEIEGLKSEVEGNLAQIQSLVSQFDISIFINEIRDAFSAKLKAAEVKIRDLTTQVGKYKDAANTIDTLSSQLEEKQRDIEHLQAELTAKEEEIAQLQATGDSVPVSIPINKTEPVSKPSVKRVGPRPSPAPPIAQQNSAQAPEGGAEKPVKFCKSCGKPRSRSTARFCIYCGAEY